MSECHVKVGQRWRDLDKRMYGTVREITRVQMNASRPYACYMDPGGFERKVSIDRLRKPFFELLTN
jgi:hypothetical protein